MNTETWFSSRVRLIVATTREGWLHFADSVFVFRARNFDHAFERALQLGRLQEESYLNDAGDTVSWTLKEVLTLDHVSAADVDGAEVHYESVDLPQGTAQQSAFRPEDSKPRQTL